jgi:asparagine synthase (glutamine-hydrolysing)
MCGIAGFISSKLSNPKQVMTNMIGTLTHRGPDNTSIWNDSNHMHMGHARLSIIDLSKNGNQPIQSKSGRYVMVFNGEIYNYIELKKEINSLANIKWIGTSDSEVLIELINYFGIKEALIKTRGMFALSLWDLKNKELTLARDRLGEKPLYYGWQNDSFIFASEIKSLKKFPGFKKDIDKNALGLYLRYNSIPAPHSIFKNIYKLSPGSIISVRHDLKKNKEVFYWSTLDEANIGKNNFFSGNYLSAVDTLDSKLLEAVNSQTYADVPLGAFLSGGIDSSTVAALMQKNSNNKINTFSIGFEYEKYNEAKHAKLVANYLGTNHHEMYLTSKDALNTIPLLPDIFDEPFADSSQIPTYLVSKIAKSKVKVCLSGDGGDELFGGYNRYLIASKLWGKISRIPKPAKSILANLIKFVKPQVWDIFSNLFYKNKYENFGFKMHKGADSLCSDNIDELYLNLTSTIKNPSEWMINSVEQKKTEYNFDTKISDIERMMIKDLVGYLPTDILTKIDRATMAASLEARTPFLDKKIVQFALSLPLKYKIKEGVGKSILRDVLYKYVPRNIVERPKMGFGIPLAEWMRTDLKDWCENLLNEKKLNEEGFFDSKIILDKWNKHLSGKEDCHHQLWNILVFQAWLDNNK